MAHPLLRPSKIVCVGRNYARHAAELGNEVPTEPLIFLKPPSALIADGDSIVMPPGVGRVDFEALVPVNDVTARDLQFSDDQWTRAKGFDTFCPVGTPVPVAEVDRAALAVETRVNGEIRQRGDAADMVFDIAAILAYISTIMTLEPGDLVATGTPEGIAPLAEGDVVEISVSGVGAVRNPVVRG